MTVSSQRPLFYERVVPLDSKHHANLVLGAPQEPFAHARGANLIPALVDEFEHAFAALPIAFLPTADGVSAVIVAGVAPGQNSFVSETGTWTAEYLPAYLRRYPFIIGDIAGADSVLCVDLDYAGFAAGTGEALFLPDGGRTEALARALGFAQAYRDAALRTERFCRMLSDFSLLEDATLEVTLRDGGKTRVQGLLMVSETALSALTGPQLVELNHAGFLRPLFLQMASLRALSRLTVPESFGPPVEGAA